MIPWKDNGNDTIDGGAGIDTASYEHANLGRGRPHLAGFATEYWGGCNDALSSIENLIGSTHNDTLTGNSGQNTFVFKQGSGADVITDFNTANHSINLADYFANAADCLATNPLQSSGLDTVVSLPGAETITLWNVNPSDLHSSHFVCHFCARELAT